MLDRSEIHIRAGKGGDGSISGRREKFVPLGGPDGGDGGDGGSVWVRGDQGLSTLGEFRFKRRFVAGDGGKGSGGTRSGRNGKDVEIRMPVGTQLWVDGETLLSTARLVRNPPIYSLPNSAGWVLLWNRMNLIIHWT